MAGKTTTPQWTKESEEWRRPHKGSGELRNRSKERTLTLRRAPTELEEPTALWFSPELKEHEATENLDDQLPATLYYLGRIKDIPQVQEAFVEKLDRGRRKHWTVLSERDYDVMDDIYAIEEDILDRFPAADISFRVTVATDGGPSISSTSTKIYDAQ